MTVEISADLRNDSGGPDGHRETLLGPARKLSLVLAPGGLDSKHLSTHLSTYLSTTAIGIVGGNRLGRKPVVPFSTAVVGNFHSALDTLRA
jgi:hypothetical protein